jgi:cytosine permease
VPGMKEKKEIKDTDFMLSPVPMSARRPTWKQVLVWVGFGYVVTGLFVGGVLAGFGGQPGVPFGTAILAIILGMGSLTVLTSLLGIAAQKTGLNLGLLSRYSYGRKGTVIPMIVMALLTLGWFASITGMVGTIWGSFLGNPSGITIFDPASMGYEGIPPVTLEVFLSCAIFGMVFTLTAFYGIKGLEAIAVPVSPVILIIAIIVGAGMLGEGGGFSGFLTEANKLGGLGLGSAITVVVGSWIAGAVMGVELFRYNKSIQGVFWGAFACFILTNPLLNIVGYIGSVTVGQFNYVEWMLGKSFLLAVIGTISWTLSLWTTNDSELYCNALYTGNALAIFGKIFEKRILVLYAGILGTIIGSLAFYQIFFDKFITVLGAMAPPLAGPIIADYYIIKKQNYVLEHYDKQPDYRAAGVVSFLIGAALGLVFEYFIRLPYDLPSGLVALVITVIIYTFVYSYTGDKEHDAKLSSVNQ